MTKYRNRTIHADGMMFDSKREWQRYCELKMLLRGGAISDLQRQVSYELVPNQRINGKVAERPVRYVADFVYRDAETGKTVVEDVKGVRTKDYIIKRKLMLWVHGIKITEVK